MQRIKNTGKIIQMQLTWTLKVVIIWLACGLFCSAWAQSWHIEGLNISRLDKGSSIEIKEASWGAEIFKNIQYHCPQSLPLYPEHACHQARLSLLWQNQQWLLSPLNSKINLLQGDGWIQADLFDQQMEVNFQLSDDQLQLALNQLSLESLSAWLPDVINQSVSAEFTGPLVFDLLESKLQTQALTLSSIEGGYGDSFFVSNVAGALGLDVDVSSLSLQITSDITQGEALVGPVYVDFSQLPVNIQVNVGLNGADGWNIKLIVQHGAAAWADLRLTLSEQGLLQQAEFDLVVQDAHVINGKLLSSVLDLYGFKQSQMSGQFSLNMSYDGNQITQGKLGFSDFKFDNSLRKLAFESLNGVVEWHQSLVKQSNLTWRSLLLAGMPVGQSGVDFEFFSDDFRILGQPEWPVFDGSILIQNWHISQLFSEFIDMEISAEIMPISLALVTEKMGWPLMKGTLSGTIPEVIKKGPVIALKGGLDLNVFEGKMRVNQLSTERLFGVAPVIAGNVSFDALNLGQLTETFDFGRITGLLSGTVDDLRITNWKTDRLKAEIHTIEKKGIKQTISQQAIDHISSLGGIQGALSRTFLRFFDDFKYKKIKLSCVLHNAVCQIGGINNTSNQFTIVEGGGIPKINIVGFVREVDWDTFISRLLNANYE